MAKNSEMKLLWNFSGKVDPNLIRSAQAVSKKITDIKKSGNGVSKTFSNITKKASSLVKYLSAGALAGGVPSLMLIAKSTADAADEFKKFSERTGISAKTLSQWSHAANMNGLTNGEFSSSVEHLNKLISDAAQGNQQAMIAFQRAGVKIKDAAGNLKTADQILMESSDTFAKMPDGIYKSSLAMAMFGKTGSNMVALLQNGSKGIKEFMSESDKLGLTFSDEDVQSAALFNDNLDLLKKSAMGVSYSIGKQLYPLISPLIKSTSEWIASNRELISAKVSEWLTKLKDNLPVIKKFVTDCYTSISSLATKIDTVVQAFGGWDTALKYLAGAFIAVKAVKIGAWVFTACKAFATFGKTLITLIPAVVKFGIALLTTPIGWIIAGIAALVVAGYMLYKHWDKVIAWIKSAWETVKSFFSSTFGDITKAFDKGFLHGIMTLLGKFNPLSLIMKAINSVFKYFTGIDLFSVASNFVKSFSDGFLKKWSAVKKSIFGVVTNFIPQIFKSCFSSISGGVAAIFNIVTKGFEAITSFITNIWSSIKTFFTSSFDEITSSFDKGFINGLMTIVSKFNPVILISKAINSVFQYFTGINLFDTASNFVKSFSDGFLKKWSAVKRTIFTAITSWLPSLVKGSISSIGKGLVNIFDVISSGWKVITDFIKNIWQGVKTFFTSSFDEITSSFDKGFINGLMTIVSKFNPLNIITKAINSVIKYFSGLDLAEQGGKFIKSFGEGILNTWNSIKDGIINTVTGWIPDWVKNSFNATPTQSYTVAQSLGSNFATLGLPAYANGGLITHHQIAELGEGGQKEMVIPLSKPQGPGLLMTAANMMGMLNTEKKASASDIIKEVASSVVNNDNSSSMSASFSPVIHINTNAAPGKDVAAQVSSAVKDEFRKFEQMLNQINYKNSRVRAN